MMMMMMMIIIIIIIHTTILIQNFWNYKNTATIVQMNCYLWCLISHISFLENLKPVYSPLLIIILQT